MKTTCRGAFAMATFFLGFVRSHSDNREWGLYNFMFTMTHNVVVYILLGYWGAIFRYTFIYK